MNWWSLPLFAIVFATAYFFAFKRIVDWINRQ